MVAGARHATGNAAVKGERKQKKYIKGERVRLNLWQTPLPARHAKSISFSLFSLPRTNRSRSTRLFLRMRGKSDCVRANESRKKQQFGEETGREEERQVHEWTITFCFLVVAGSNKERM